MQIMRCFNIVRSILSDARIIFQLHIMQNYSLYCRHWVIKIHPAVLKCRYKSEKCYEFLLLFTRKTNKRNTCSKLWFCHSSQMQFFYNYNASVITYTNNAMSVLDYTKAEAFFSLIFFTAASCIFRKKIRSFFL